MRKAKIELFGGRYIEVDAPDDCRISGEITEYDGYLFLPPSFKPSEIITRCSWCLRLATEQHLDGCMVLRGKKRPATTPD